VKYVIQVGYKETIPSATAWSWSFDYCLFYGKRQAHRQTNRHSNTLLIAKPRHSIAECKKIAKAFEHS